MDPRNNFEIVTLAIWKPLFAVIQPAFAVYMGFVGGCL